MTKTILWLRGDRAVRVRKELRRTYRSASAALGVTVPHPPTRPALASPVVPTGLSGGGVLRALDGQTTPVSPAGAAVVPPVLQPPLRPKARRLSPPLVIEGGGVTCAQGAENSSGREQAGQPVLAGSRTGAGLTLIHVDVVLPLLLVARAVVAGALHDVCPLPDVVPDRHLLQAAVRVPHGPPGLTDLRADSNTGPTLSFLLPAPQDPLTLLCPTAVTSHRHHPLAARCNIAERDKWILISSR